MSTKYRLDKDLSEAKKMADALEEYIRGADLYGNVGGMFGSGDTPALTVGALVLRLRRLEAQRGQMSAAQQLELDKAREKHTRVQKDWAVHYESKVLKEARSRLEAMKTFFQECQDQPRTCHANYQPEVLRRTIVQELLHVMEACRINSAEVKLKMAEADSKLHGIVTAAPFVWDTTLQAVYPDSEYWWLYQAPPLQPDNGQN